jgi:anti-sigma regulatory factor (Ser/Thr protein kinase)
MRKPSVNEAVRALIAGDGRVSTGELAARLGVSRQAAHRHLARLVRAGTLERRGRGRSAHYGPAEGKASRRVVPVAGLEEDALWQRIAAEEPALSLPEAAASIARYAFTEMVNNAIEHARAGRIELELYAAPPLLRIEIQDDGVGIFRRLAAHLGVEQPELVIEQLAKGKLTTDPERHTGEGIFFTSKAVDVFAIASSGICWLVDNRVSDFTIRASRIVDGTRVGLAIDPRTTRRLRDLFDAYTEDAEFARTRVVVRLYEHGVELVSRSEARRLLIGLERFREVVLDFAGVRGVGQGFADEVLRVWPSAHAGVRMAPVNMSAEVAFMVERATRGAQGGISAS